MSNFLNTFPAKTFPTCRTRHPHLSLTKPIKINQPPQIPLPIYPLNLAPDPPPSVESPVPRHRIWPPKARLNVSLESTERITPANGGLRRRFQGKINKYPRRTLTVAGVRRRGEIKQTGTRKKDPRLRDSLFRHRKPNTISKAAEL